MSGDMKLSDLPKEHSSNIKWLESHGFGPLQGYQQRQDAFGYGIDTNFGANQHFKIYLHKDGRVSGGVEYLHTEFLKSSPEYVEFKTAIDAEIDKANKLIDGRFQKINKVNDSKVEILPNEVWKKEFLKEGSCLIPFVTIDPCNESAEQVYKRLAETLEIMESEGVIKEDISEMYRWRLERAAKFNSQ